MAIRRPGDENDPDVQLTSFMDCAFLLLIFFIVTASLKKPHKELNIELPNAGHSRLAKHDKDLIISVTVDGERYLYDGKTYQNQSPLGRQELMGYLQKVSGEDKNTPIVLDIDRRTPYHHVMDVVDTLEFYNLKKVHLRSQHGFKAEHDRPEKQ